MTSIVCHLTLIFSLQGLSCFVNPITLRKYFRWQKSKCLHMISVFQPLTQLEVYVIQKRCATVLFQFDIAPSFSTYGLYLPQHFDKRGRPGSIPTSIHILTANVEINYQFHLCISSIPLKHCQSFVICFGCVFTVSLSVA